MKNEEKIMENMEKLSDCEEMIMSLLWSTNDDLDLQQVIDRMKGFGKEWKPQTTATFMSRIEKKGYISIYRVGRYSHYHPEVKLHDYRKQKLEEVKVRLLFDDRGSMIDFIENM